MPRNLFGPSICFQSQHSTSRAPNETADAALIDRIRRPGLKSAQRYRASDGDDTATVIEAETLQSLHGQLRARGENTAPYVKSSKIYLGQEIYRSHPSFAVAEDAPLLLCMVSCS